MNDHKHCLITAPNMSAFSTLLDGPNVVIVSEVWRSRAAATGLRSPGSPRAELA